MFSINLQLFGGRGASSGANSRFGVSGSNIKGLKDSDDFRTFMNQNMSNPEFKEFGKEYGMQAVKALWYDRQVQKEELREISKEDAIKTVRENIPQNVRDGWFRDADSDYKPKMMDAIASNPGTYNAGLNIAYSNYKESLPKGQKAMSFDKWTKTPQTMYRGEYGQKQTKNDVFTSYTPSKKVAQSFGKNVSTIKMRPKDTWGSYQTTGEQEYFIPVKQPKKR